MKIRKNRKCLIISTALPTVDSFPAPDVNRAGILKSNTAPALARSVAKSTISESARIAISDLLLTPASGLATGTEFLATLSQPALCPPECFLIP